MDFSLVPTLSTDKIIEIYIRNLHIQYYNKQIIFSWNLCVVSVVCIYKCAPGQSPYDLGPGTFFICFVFPALFCTNLDNFVNNLASYNA